MPKVNLGGFQLYYESHGEDREGEPLLLVSGLGGVAAYWKPNLAAFSAKYRTIVHDHRGAGQSSAPKMRYSVAQMTEDVLRLMDHLKIERAHLVGHSTGGAIGQTIAAKHPERLSSLVLYATWTQADEFFRRVFEARRALLTACGPAAYVRGASVFLYPGWWIDENAKALEERERIAIANFPPPEVVASRIDAIVAFDRTADLARIRTRTLVLGVRDDFVTPAYFSEELARRIPGAKLTILERGGHCASETLPDQFNRTVLEFLKG